MSDKNFRNFQQNRLKSIRNYDKMTKNFNLISLKALSGLHFTSATDPV